LDEGGRIENPWANGEWPGVPRVAAGVKDRVNRLRCLGNAVVPQIPELIGRAIMKLEN
jgi:DNA (cytosine-5)-methyltransferase 1